MSDRNYDESNQIEKLYEFGERLNESKDKSQNVTDYEGIIELSKTSIKAKQLGAQLIPRYFKFFPSLSTKAFDAHVDYLEEEDLGVRVQAIRGLPLFCKDTPEFISKIVDVLVQIFLTCEDTVERDAVHKALMSLLRQDAKASLSALFKWVGTADEPATEDAIREKVLNFIRDKVFPLNGELLKPQEEMERHITDLIKKSLADVTGEEFKMFMDFLTSLSIFGVKAPTERMQELVEIIEGQADLDAQFNVEDTDHIARLISCLHMALPFFARGAPGSKFLNYLNKHIMTVFDKLPEERKLDLLKALADISPYTTAQEARQILPSIVQLLKKYMPARRTGEEMNFTYVECLLYAFHHLAHKAPNATNSLCGYKIVTGQPSDRLGEDFSEFYKDFTERLTNVEELTKATMRKLTQGMSEHNKAMSAAKTDEEKESFKTKKQNTTTGLRTCNNILAMTKPLHAKAPSFIGDKSINLSWKEAVKPSTPTTAGGKRPAGAANGADNAKRGRGSGGLQNQLVNKAFEGISYGGRGGRGGWGRRGRGGRGQGRGRGRGYYW
ncbi:PREDICTED: apoptosis inhibitor 5-like protein API5 [Tarenaya hassleriana]|uniref:apoptosis inhibitor 5-like protein API5 n=1 Tax=Tarenaya hassleriana TaxID=28532 RepID=UPI00053C4F1F|nr:PREDICTED: apoptosis inhibitor 5-like protein API5 [Tarenaya hassleriana]